MLHSQKLDDGAVGGDGLRPVVSLGIALGLQKVHPAGASDFQLVGGLHVKLGSLKLDGALGRRVLRGVEVEELPVAQHEPP